MLDVANTGKICEIKINLQFQSHLKEFCLFVHFFWITDRPLKTEIQDLGELLREFYTLYILLDITWLYYIILDNRKVEKNVAGPNIFIVSLSHCIFKRIKLIYSY